MTTKLRLYNDALRYIKHRKLSGLTESVESRRVLDDAYTGLVDAVLEQGGWKFAMRTSELSYDTDVTPTFGYARAFAQPADFVRLYALAHDEYQNNPLLDFKEEAGYWYSHYDTVYVSYVSNGVTYGGDLSVWPETFARYAALWLANEVVERLNPEMDPDRIERKMRSALTDALAKDAIAMAPRFMHQGTWTRARGTSNRRDRGNRGSLIG